MAIRVHLRFSQQQYSCGEARMRCRVLGKGKTVEAEIARVKSIGGWVSDGRVCDVLAVSRAFGDPQFKGKGLPSLLQLGIK